MTNHTDKTVSNWEKHVQTGIGLLVSGLLYWNGNAVVSLGEQVAVINVRLEQFVDIKKEIDILKVNAKIEHDEISDLKERTALIEYKLYKEKGG